MLDLTTKYLGLELKNPLVVSSSPLSAEVENIRRMEEAGAAAVVLPSLFEEQFTLPHHELDCHLTRGMHCRPETLSYFPAANGYRLDPHHYVKLIREAKAAVRIPIIGSLNGVSTGTWTKWVDYARHIEDAGADAVELNIYFIPTDPVMTGEQVERMYCQLVHAVKHCIRVPVAVKVGPYFSSMVYMARRFEQAGADALVLFNRFYQPDLDPDHAVVVPRVTLSRPEDLLLGLHWAAILFPTVKLDLALSGGVHGARDVLKALMAGARVAMMTSALLQNGIGHLATVLGELADWMAGHGYQSVRHLRGSMSHWAVAEPAAFERGSYLRVLASYGVKKTE